MLSKDKLSVEKIKQLADDIRVINGFVENHGFDGNLLSVNVSPQSNIRRIDRSIFRPHCCDSSMFSNCADKGIW